MTQSNAIVPMIPQGDAGQATSGPKLSFVLKKHRVLIVVGTILGILVALGLFFILRKYNRYYRAEAVIKVLPFTPDPLREHANSYGSLSDEIKRLINSQILVVRSPVVLSQALQTRAFQRNYKYPNDPSRKSTWLEAHPVTPLVYLRNDLIVEPVRESNDFTISLYWHDPRETASLVNAVTNTYLQYVENLEAASLNKEAKAVAAAQARVAARVQAQQRELELYRRSRNVPGLIERDAILDATLANLSSLLTKAQIDAQAAQANYESIKKQVENNTLQLSPRMQELVNDDPTLRSLSLNLLSLKQEVAVSKATLGIDHRATIALEIREASVQRQIDRLRQKLEVRARLQMQQGAKSQAEQAMAIAVETRNRRNAKRRLVSDLDDAVAKYRNRESVLKTQEKMLATLTSRADLFNLRLMQNSSRVKLQYSASVPESMAFPKLKRFLVLGPILGLLAALALAYLLELTNTRVRTPRDISGIMRLPLLGFIPDHADDSMLSGNPMTCIRTSPASMTAESFRQIRGRLAVFNGEKPLQTLLVASFSPAGGASTVASNIANGIALSELRVLLVDANFYRPVLQTVYSNIPGVGLADVLTGRCNLDQAIVPCADLPTLHLMGAGARSKSPNEITEHRAFPDLLAQLKSRYDMIIFDGAPLTFVSDSINLAAKVDGVIAVVRAGQISRGTVGRIRDQLSQVRANLVGIVLNATQSWNAGYFKENYRTFFEYANQSKRPDAPRNLPSGKA